MEWQPIDTAPKDGTFIILGGGMWGDEELAAAKRVMIARWLNDEWMVCVAEGGYSCFPIIGPTHWMPVPQQPGCPPTPRSRFMPP